MYRRTVFLVYSGLVTITLMVLCAFGYLFYTRASITGKFSELKDINLQANRTTALRAETQLYMVGPTSSKQAHLLTSLNTWAAGNAFIMQRAYPDAISYALTMSLAPATCILNDTLALSQKPSNDLYVTYVTCIGQYNYALLTTENLLIDNTQQTRDTAQVTDYVFLAVCLAVLFTEYLVAIRPSLHGLHTLLTQHVTRKLESDGPLPE